MILSRNPILFSYLCKLAYSLGNHEIKFNKNSKQVTLVQDSSIHLYSQWTSYASAFLVSIYALQYALEPNSTPMEHTLHWISLLILAIGNAYIYQVKSKRSEITFLVQSLFKLESIFPAKDCDNRTPLKIRAKVAVVYAAMLSAILIPIGFVHGQHWANPCKTTLAGYWIIRKCYAATEAVRLVQDVADHVVQFGVIIVNHWLWSFSFHAAVFGVGFIMILGMIVLQQFIQRFDLLNKLYCVKQLKLD